ncbi:MAG: DHA2 family efflux MFS transporter permease subunit [Thermomicrobiales bacterium]
MAVVFVCGMFMSSLDSTAVNVALATLSRQFGVPTASIDEVVVGYLVSLAVFIPASGWLGDRFGTKRVFLIALALFTGASALCGAAQSFNQLVLFRFLQGAGGGMLTPVGTTMLYRTFPPSERVQVSRILIFPRILGPAGGPVLGGLLTTQFSWRWVFYINLPVGIAAFVFGLLFLHEHRESVAGRFDLPGFLLAATSFPLVMYALSEGPSHGWTSPVILGCAVIGLLLLIVFVAVELRARAPMVHLRLLGDRLFNTTNLVTIFSSAGFSGILFLVPLFLQEARGADPLSSGLTTFPEALGVLCSTQLVARLYPRVGPRRLMAGGLIGVTTAISLLCFIRLDSSPWLIRLLMFLIGVGMAYVFLPAQAAGFATISPAATGQAAMLSNVQRQLGLALGVAILSSVLAAVGPVQRSVTGVMQPHLAAYRAAFLTAAAFALIGALIALAVPDRDAAATMRPRPKRAAPSAAPQESLVPDVGWLRTRGEDVGR